MRVLMLANNWLGWKVAEVLLLTSDDQECPEPAVPFATEKDLIADSEIVAFILLKP